MDSSRRNVLGLVAGAAIGIGPAAAQPAPPVRNVTGDPRSMPKAGTPGLRLVTFAQGDPGEPKIGVVKDNGRIVDLGAASKAAGGTIPFDPADMVSLIAAGQGGLARVRELAATGQDGPMLSEVRLLPPIPRPSRNVYAVGWNYLEHFEEGQAARGQKSEYPEHPVFFPRPSGR